MIKNKTFKIIVSGMIFLTCFFSNTGAPLAKISMKHENKNTIESECYENHNIEVINLIDDLNNNFGYVYNCRTQNDNYYTYSIHLKDESIKIDLTYSKKSNDFSFLYIKTNDQNVNEKLVFDTMQYILKKYEFNQNEINQLISDIDEYKMIDIFTKNSDTVFSGFTTINENDQIFSITLNAENDYIF